MLRRAAVRTAERQKTGRTVPGAHMSAKIHIGSSYDGCPYCRATGYFRCGRCRMFSCWDSYTRDHTWITPMFGAKLAGRGGAPRRKGEDDNSLSELTAYAARENTVDLRSRIAPGSTMRDQINPAISIRGYLK